MSNYYAVLLLIMLFITSACDSPKENPLKGLPSGVWAPATNTSSKEVGIKSLSGDGTLSYKVPFLITDNNATTLNYYNSISNKTEFPVEKNEEGNWETLIYPIGTLLLESNPSKDTLSCFYEDEQGKLERIDYVLLIETPKTKGTAEVLRKQLRGTTWSLSPALKIVFHKLPDEVDGTSILSHYINQADSSDIKDIVGSFYFQQNKDFVFMYFNPLKSLNDDFFVLKNINEAQTELQLVPLIDEVNDSIVVLKMDTQDIPYVDSLRQAYILATKINAAM